MPRDEIEWQESHATDFLALHEALQAVTSLDFSGTTHTDWLGTVQAVRARVNSFALFIPNAPKVVSILDTVEKILLAVKAVENLAKDA